ncbi:MAG TPA: ATP-dependent DNA ligase [Candidatus Dormibacteraeota bacterium]|nr:ATP-dependent DNA ligase [Candidatus Dormibacteraeota bacterium]
MTIDSENLAKAQFAVLAQLCEQLAATAARGTRTRLVADYLRRLTPDAIAVATRLLLGRVFRETQGRRLSLGGAAVWSALQAAGAATGDLQWAGAVDFGGMVAAAMPPLPAGAPLTLADVAHAFAAIAAASGAGSRRRRIDLLADLLRRATPVEAKYLAKIVVGEMRHGVQEGIVLDAAAMLAGVTPAAIRRAQQALSDIGRVAALAASDPAQLAAAEARLFHPLKPMLAQSAPDVAAAWEALDGRLALEWKLDGARVQIHKQGDTVRIFSRRLQEITASLPDVADAVRRDAAADTAIFEGEVLAVSGDRPLPFQELMRRFRRLRDVATMVGEVPTRLYLFDLLREGDALLLDHPLHARWAALRRACGSLTCVAHIEPDAVATGAAFYREAIAAGHEGVMAKALDSAYTPGVRGAAWLKVKRTQTVDLVIIAADWGYGRRHGWLSNYHLAARDGATGALLPVGKTFKGPTDAEFAAMTARLLALKTGEARGTVFVRPEVVVEVRFEGVQTSPQYAAGVALRFARIVRVRDDKQAAEIDTIETLRAWVR